MPERDRERDCRAVPVDRRGLDRIDQLQCLLGRRRLVGMGEQHAELVAAEAADEVGFADFLGADFGDALQRGITGGVAVCIVDALSPLRSK